MKSKWRSSSIPTEKHVYHHGCVVGGVAEERKQVQERIKAREGISMVKQLDRKTERG